MKVGYACTPLRIPNKTTKSFILKNYSEDILINCISSNLKNLIDILNYNISNEIYLFRISSDIIPFASHEINTFNWENYFKNDLDKISTLIKRNSLRISMHPGQYTVLNSNNKNTVSKSIRDLEYHCNFLDSLNLDSTCKIILHVGGVYNDKKLAINNFINNYNLLSKNIKKRLVIENDEKNYNIKDLLYISEKCSIPIIYDNLHYTCYEGHEADNYSVLNSIKKTWNKEDGTIKVHYSEQNKIKKKGSHSSTISCNGFLNYINSLNGLDIDIMTEVKDKDFSAIKTINLLNELRGNLSEKSKTKELESYKYYLKEKGKDIFEKSKYILNTKGLIEFYKFIDGFIYSEPISECIINTLKEVYLELEEYLSKSEINHFHKLFNDKKFQKAKEYLYKLALKKKLYNALSMYYFYN